MTEATLEHANVTVKDPKATAAMLGRLFGWRVRWEGPAKDDGFTVHVGGENSYLALYAPAGAQHARERSTYVTPGGLNHLGVTVDDLDAAEARVRADGYEPHSFADYEPGRRFYFHEENGIEIEVVSYA